MARRSSAEYKSARKKVKGQEKEKEKKGRRKEERKQNSKFKIQRTPLVYPLPSENMNWQCDRTLY
jgi:hypothetical protein